MGIPLFPLIHSSYNNFKTDQEQIAKHFPLHQQQLFDSILALVHLQILFALKSFHIVNVILSCVVELSFIFAIYLVPVFSFNKFLTNYLIRKPLKSNEPSNSF